MKTSDSEMVATARPAAPFPTLHTPVVASAVGGLIAVLVTVGLIAVTIGAFHGVAGRTAARRKAESQPT
jgi:hypothetical protein